MASERCSRLRLLRIEPGALGRIALVLLLAFLTLPRTAASQSEEARSVPAGESAASHLDRFLDEVTTLEADFEQEVYTAQGQLAERQSGTFALERPSRFRWYYEEPAEQLIVADGKNLWIYDVEIETVTVTPLDDAASTPAMLLSGDRAVREGFSIVEELQQDGLFLVRLEPEIEGADFRSVLIGFDGVMPRRLEIVDTLGYTTRIALFDVELNGTLDADAFRFEPPRGVDVIGTAAR